MKGHKLENQWLSLALDERGRLVSLRNKATKTELIAFRDAAEAWRMIVPTGRHTVAFLVGSEQRPDAVEHVREAGAESLVLSYSSLKLEAERLDVGARFILTLRADSAQIVARVELDNRSPFAIDEVEFPIVGGLGGFAATGGRKTLQLVAARDQGAFHGDVLTNGLPDTGRESNHYVRRLETAMFACYGDPNLTAALDRGVWLDLWSERQGLYVALHPQQPQLFALKLEKHPKEVPNRPAHAYPPGTRRWVRVHALHIPRVQPGSRWTSQPIIVMPHCGDWHAGADCYAAYRHERIAFCEPPAWMRDFVGWTEILGKTYLGEVFHDYRHCAESVARDSRRTGLNLVFYYGHSKLGAEGADFDNGPADDLGGEAGFRAMLDELHRHGVRVMLLDHVHRWVNRDVPQYAKLGLERFAILDRRGRPVEARWWKETALSCLYLDGPTPVWIEMCPACPEWLEHYKRHLTRMIELGVDALELDTFQPSACFNPAHSHPPGDVTAAKLQFIRAARAHAKRLNPDFALFGETVLPEAREVVDGYYPFRYLDENGRIFRYLFPELRQQAVLVGNYAYDQVNKALQLGIGVETEIDGLRKTAQDACPELARYIGEVNRFRRRYPEMLLRGTFRDTVGARVEGEVFYSVFDGPDGSRALVLRNPTARPLKVTATLDGVRGRRLLLWQPFRREKTIARLPLSLRLPGFGLAVLLAS